MAFPIGHMKQLPVNGNGCNFQPIQRRCLSQGWGCKPYESSDLNLFELGPRIYHIDR